LIFFVKDSAYLGRDVVAEGYSEVACHIDEFLFNIASFNIGGQIILHLLYLVKILELR
jgi:hypothetical protein